MFPILLGRHPCMPVEQVNKVSAFVITYRIADFIYFVLGGSQETFGLFHTAVRQNIQIGFAKLCGQKPG